MIQILVTVLMIVVVMLAIIKKFHATTVLFAVSIVALLGYSLVTGTSVMGENSTGNLFLDVFELLRQTTETQVAGNGLICMLFMGYIQMMEKLQASDLFAMYIGKVISKIKQRYLLTAMLTVLCACLKLFLGSAIVVVMLLLSILYPSLRRSGCTNATICSCLVMGTAITWGPTDGGVVATPGLAGVDLSAAEFFMSYQIIPCVCALLTIAVVGIFTSMYFDKKEAAKGKVDEEITELKDFSQVKCPKYYAILPTLPLIFVVLFSGNITSITLTTAAAVTLALCTAFVVHLLSNLKRFGEAFNEIIFFYKGMGNAVANVMFIIVAGSLMASTINMVGGMAALIEWMQTLGGGVYFLATIGAILGFVTVALTVSYMANLNIFVPFFKTIGDLTGYSTLRLAAIANASCGLGTGMAIASNTMLFLTGMCKTDAVTVLKRNIIPLLCGFIVMLVVSFIIG